MKLNLKDLSLCFPAIKQVFDSITDFNRAWELLPSFKKIQEAYELYHEKRDKVIFSINPEGSISAIQAKEFEEKMRPILSSEIDVDPIYFYKEEVAAAKLLNSQLIYIHHFTKRD